MIYICNMQSLILHVSCIYILSLKHLTQTLQTLIGFGDFIPYLSNHELKDRFFKPHRQ